MSLNSLDSAIREHTLVIEQLRSAESAINGLARELTISVREARSIFLCGNGGSAATCSHFATEFVGRFGVQRRPWRMVNLGADPVLITAVANDFGFEEVFARHLEALARPADLLIAFSTSGSSRNLVEALKTARALQLRTAAITGDNARELGSLATVVVRASSSNAARIQEAHLMLTHLLCSLVEDAMLSGAGLHVDPER